MAPLANSLCQTRLLPAPSPVLGHSRAPSRRLPLPRSSTARRLNKSALTRSGLDRRSEVLNPVPTRFRPHPAADSGRAPSPAPTGSRSPSSAGTSELTMSSSAMLRGHAFAQASAGSPAEEATQKKLVVSFGEMLIDFVPTVNGVALAEAPGFIPAPGGAPANVAVGVSRLGGQAAFVGKLGDEEFGRMLVRILEQNGVDVSGVRLDQTARTALAFVTLRSDGEREFMFYRNPSADMLLTPDELDTSLIAQSAVVHYGSISLIAEPCKSAHMKLMDVAAESGAILSYDANLRLPLWPSPAAAKEGILSIWDKANVAKLSDEEVLFLTEETAKPSDSAVASLGSRLDGADELDRRALSLWHDKLQVLLVTFGGKGCRYYMKGAMGSVSGFKVNPVDATGAGDAFVAGFLVQLAECPEILQSEEGLKKALSLANACGAITTTKRGAIPSLPTMDAALELMKTSVQA